MIFRDQSESAGTYSVDDLSSFTKKTDCALAIGSIVAPPDSQPPRLSTSRRSDEVDRTNKGKVYLGTFF